VPDTCWSVRFYIGWVILGHYWGVSLTTKLSTSWRSCIRGSVDSIQGQKVWLLECWVLGITSLQFRQIAPTMLESAYSAKSSGTYCMLSHKRCTISCLHGPLPRGNGYNKTLLAWEKIVQLSSSGSGLLHQVDWGRNACVHHREEGTKFCV